MKLTSHRLVCLKKSTHVQSGHRGRPAVDSPASQDPRPLAVSPGAPAVLPGHRADLGRVLEGSHPEQNATFVLANARHSASAVPHSIGTPVARYRALRQVLGGPRGHSRAWPMSLPFYHKGRSSRTPRELDLRRDGPPSDQLLRFRREFLRSAGP